MIQQKTNIQKLLLSITITSLIFLLSSCSDDLYENTIQEQNGLIIKKVSLKELSRNGNLELFKSIDRIRTNQHDTNARIVYDSINKFYFDDENGKEIIAPDGKKSYTFPIYSEGNDGKVENIVFVENNLSEYDTYKVKYDFTDEELKILSQQELQQQTVTYTNISSRQEEIMCVYFYIWQPYPIDNGDLTGNFGNTGHWVVTFTFCENVIPSSGSSQGGIGNSGNNTNPNTNNPPGGNTGYTSPIVLDDEEQAWIKYNQFTNNLPENQQNWLDLNSSINGEIFTFFRYNGFGGSNMTFIKNTILRIMQNPIFTSIKPFVIEKKIDDSQLEPCSKDAFQQIKNTTQSDFAQVLAKLGADDSVYNVLIETADTPLGTPGNTKWDSPYNYTIKLDPDYPNATKLGRASILLHEIVHAFFMSLFDDYHNGAPTNPNAYDDFAILYQKYVDKTFPGSSSTAHHAQMASTYVNAIATALQEYQTGVAVPNGTQPQQVYIDLAWGGLQEAPIFNEPTGPLSAADRERIVNRYNCEMVGHAVQVGTPQQQTPVGQPCN